MLTDIKSAPLRFSTVTPADSPGRTIERSHHLLLDEPVEVARRRALLLRPSMRPLALLAARMRAETGHGVPDADPLDGGVGARLLLLLERPAAAVRRGGFVSRDNATPTARNIRHFFDAAGLPRNTTLIWNAVPWMDAGPPVATARRARNAAPRPDEIRAGLLWLPPLLDLLPDLEVAVLAGRVAGQASAALLAARPGLPVLTMPHPSPTIVCTSPRIGESIMRTLATAAAALRLPPVR